MIFWIDFALALLAVGLNLKAVQLARASRALGLGLLADAGEQLSLANARLKMLEIERGHVRMLLRAWPDESTIAAAERAARGTSLPRELLS